MAATISTKAATAAAEVPKVVTDPRFRAGRRLLTEAHQSEAAIQVFASLLKEAEKAFGAADSGTTIEMAPVFYEYGNALFRHYEAGVSLEEQQEAQENTSTTTATVKVEGTASSSSKSKDGAIDTPAMQKKRKEAAAAAAEKRFQKKPASEEESIHNGDDDKYPAAVSSQPENLDSKGEPQVPIYSIKKNDGDIHASQEEKEQHDEVVQDAEAPDSNEQAEEEYDEDEDNEDIQLSLEMMEEAYSIIDEYLEKTGNDTSIAPNAQSPPPNYRDWAWEQQSRVLTGIADVLSTMGRHADAADAYIRALELRKQRLQQVFASSDEDKDKKKKMTVEYLRARRLIVESNTLIAHEFLQCDPDADVVTSESKALIVRAAGRVDYAREYYENARDELQEAVLLLAQLTAAGGGGDGDGEGDLAREKENVCYASTLVMDVGMRLAQIDDEVKQQATESSSRQPVKKKAKR